MHLLFAERRMLSSAQLMLRPRCRPEWGEKKAGSQGARQGKWQESHGRAGGGSAGGAGSLRRVEVRAARGARVRLGIRPFEGIREKRGDPQPLKSRSSPQAAPLAPAPRCHGEPGACDVWPPRTERRGHPAPRHRHLPSRSILLLPATHGVSPLSAGDRGGRADVPCCVGTRERHSHRQRCLGARTRPSGLQDEHRDAPLSTRPAGASPGCEQLSHGEGTRSF